MPGSSAPAGGAATTPVAPQDTTPPALYDKSIQPISVANASAVTGRSIELVQALAGAGFTQAWQAGNVPSQKETQVLYGTSMADVAADVAALFNIPASAVKPDPAVSGVSLVVGTDWVSGTEFGKIVVPEDIVASTADQGGECLKVNPLYYTY